MLREISTAASLVGVDTTLMRRAARGVVPYVRRRSEFMEIARQKNEFVIGRPFPCFGDREGPAGATSGQYFHQDLYVAQQICAANPTRHVDVGSRVDGFVAHVASFRAIDVFDIRPLPATIRNVTSYQQDIMTQDTSLDECTDSLSCLHALEHFGLGRYGDPLDYYGYKTAFANLARMVKPNGTFYLSLPIGEPQRIEFDAHRIFSMSYILRELIADPFSIDRFAYVDDAGDLHRDVDIKTSAPEATFGLELGCGIFTLRKRQ